MRESSPRHGTGTVMVVSNEAAMLGKLGMSVRAYSNHNTDVAARR